MPSKPQTQTTAPAAEAATIDMTALLAAAATRQQQGNAVSRSARYIGADGRPVYGVFVTPCGHIISVDYTTGGKELQQWGTYSRNADGSLTRVATHRRKVDALDALDAAREAAAAAE